MNGQGLFGLFNLLQTRFGRLRITVEAEEGSIAEADIEDKVRETFRQIGAEAEIE